MQKHIPVLLQEVREGLHIEKGDTIVDATLGAGGYTHVFCNDVGSNGTVIGIDQDAGAVELVREEFKDSKCNIHLVVGNFRNVAEIVTRKGITEIDGIAFDIGFSSTQLESSGRGFSFQKNEPLLMTFKENPSESDLTAENIVNTWNEESLANVFFGYGQERQSRKIARTIVNARAEKPIKTTMDLVQIIESAVKRRGKIHPATKVFQSLRIAVNDELEALIEGMTGALTLLKPGGRIAVVSFHSLEDKIVKNIFREQQSKGEGTIITKKVIKPKDTEISQNPRARSAKLRVFEK